MAKIKKTMQLKLTIYQSYFFKVEKENKLYLLLRPNVHIKKTTIIFLNEEHRGSL